MSAPNQPTRTIAPVTGDSTLGPLAQLPGTWANRSEFGWNTIALPWTIDGAVTTFRPQREPGPARHRARLRAGDHPARRRRPPADRPRWHRRPADPPRAGAAARHGGPRRARRADASQTASSTPPTRPRGSAQHLGRRHRPHDRARLRHHLGGRGSRTCDSSSYRPMRRRCGPRSSSTSSPRPIRRVAQSCGCSTPRSSSCGSCRAGTAGRGASRGRTSASTLEKVSDVPDLQPAALHGGDGVTR